MFVRLNNDLPSDPSFEASLEKLGYTVNDKGEFVSIADPTQHFTFFISDNERVNEVHKEAMHICIRERVDEELAAMGVKRLYLGGKDGAKVVGDVKPEEKHISVLATEMDVLKEKKSVVVVVGEHNQDCGIWAWRSVSREGGMMKGSAVGMVKQLQQNGLHSKPLRTTSLINIMRTAPTTTPPEATFTQLTRIDSPIPGTEMPGIIILNPGQLLFSYAEEKCMTWATWHARPRPSAVSAPYAVDPVHNYVPGHTSASEHIFTMFDRVIPQLIRQDANLYVIGITDGAERFLNWYDRHGGPVADRVHGMAFMEPTHNPASIVRVPVELNKKAKSWIKSSLPLGEWINSPDGMKKYVPSLCPDLDAIAPPSPVGSDDSVTTKAVGPEMRALGKSIEEFKVREAEEKASKSPPSTSGGDDDDAWVGITPNASSEVTEDEQTGGEYDYSTRFVSCHTYSGGEEGVDELLLGNVMGRVLDWFQWRSEEKV